MPVDQWNDAAMEKFTKWAHYFSTWLILFLWFRVQTSISLNEEDPLNIEFPTERNAVSGTSSVHQYMNVSISQIAVKYCSFFQIFMCFAIRCLNILITAFFCLSALHALFFSDCSLLSFFSLSLFKTHCSSMPDPMDPVEFTISPLPQEIVKDFNDHACLQSGKRIAVPVIKTYSKSKGNI